MRVCDRKGCSERQAQTIMVATEEIDLCAKHYTEFMEYIKSPSVIKKKTRGRAHNGRSKP